MLDALSARKALDRRCALFLTCWAAGRRHQRNESQNAAAQLKGHLNGSGVPESV